MEGNTAKVAKDNLEKNLGRKIISNANNLNYQYMDNKKIDIGKKNNKIIKK